MKNTQYKKKSRLIIDKEFQFSFLKYFALLSFLQMLTQLVLISLFQNKYSQMIKDIGIAEGDIISVFFEKQTDYLFWTTLAASLFFLVFMLVVGLRLSHKVAGPIRRAMLYLASDEHETKELKFRKDDYFKDLADSINTFVKNKK